MLALTDSANARNCVQSGLKRFLRASLAMKGNGKAVGFIPDALQKQQKLPFPAET